MSKLKIKFESDQPHQIQAIESTVKLFQGFTKKQNGSWMGDDTKPNLDPYEMLDEGWLFDNLLAVQRENKLVEDMYLNFEDGFELMGNNSWRYPYYTVEMETGTGKTYVYFRTILELRKHYGWNKFIIIVPSVAIYEGVVKTFAITREHFKTLYGNETVNLIEYSGQQISKLRNFSTSSTVEILLMTIDSFNKESNVFYKPTEKLQGEKLPYQYVQDARPILILDESQNYTSEGSKMALRTLHPLFALKYSATPTEKGRTREENRELMNRIYHLSPVEAFRMNLVKKIEVFGITEQFNLNDNQISFVFKDSKKGYGLEVEARLNVSKDGKLLQDTLRLKKGDDLYERTKNENYRGLEIEEINRNLNVVIFTNGESINVAEGGAVTLSKEEIFRVQIEETIKAHMIKQKHLITKGIKVLSLFFIDKVANYVENDGIIKKLFDEAFEKQKQKFGYYKGWKAEQVRQGYFAKKTAKNKPDQYVDTAVENKTQAEKEMEKEAYNLIMKEKERLLSFDEPVCFIFAHSALKEGWDNPNVFQICTLNTATSERRKRQEIGRGLRLSVNQEGVRVTDEGVNILTVVANESYESYCEQLQTNYTEDGAVAPPAPSNARKTEAKRNDKIFNSADFKKFWAKLCQKTEYQINLDDEQLVKECIQKLAIAKYPEPNIVVVKGKFVMTSFKITMRKAHVDQAQLEITITDTDNNETKSLRWFRRGEDLSKTLKEPRLQGFKIVDLIVDDGHSEIVYGDRGTFRMNETFEFATEKGQVIDPGTRVEAQTNYPVFNFIERATQATSLKKDTLLIIFKELPTEVKERVFKNPEGFTAVFIETIKNTLADHIVDKIEYKLTKDLMDFDKEEMFPKSKKYPQKELLAGAEWSLYDFVQIDSDIEKGFIQNQLNGDEDIVCYFKFPNSFKVLIPKIIQNYNPDWGVIRWDEKKELKLELVRETKGQANPNLLQYPNEFRKIKCAEKHFAQTGIDYKQIKGDEKKWW